MIQKIVARFLPILLLLIISKYVSQFGGAYAERFETNIRLVALIQAIINVPFGLSLFTGIFSLNKKHFIYSVFVFIISLFHFFLYSNEPLVLIGFISYSIRVMILNRSLVQNMDMRFVQLLVYYCSPVVLYISLIEHNSIVNITLIILGISLLILHPKIKNTHSAGVSKVYSANSLLGLLLTNIDLLCLGYLPTNVSLNVLYARRLSMFFEAFIQGIVQTSTYSSLIEQRRRLVKPVMAFGIVVSLISPFILNFWVGNTPYEIWIVGLMLVGLLKSISMLYERSVLDDSSLVRNLNFLNGAVILLSVYWIRANPLVIILVVPFILSIIRFWLFYEYYYTRR